MEQQNKPPGRLIGSDAVVEWKVDAIVHDDSKKFAEELQKILNAASLEGYAVSNLMTRATDNGLVVIQQRIYAKVQPEGVPHPGAN